MVIKGLPNTGRTKCYGSVDSYPSNPTLAWRDRDDSQRCATVESLAIWTQSVYGGSHVLCARLDTSIWFRQLQGKRPIIISFLTHWKWETQPEIESDASVHRTGTDLWWGSAFWQETYNGSCVWLNATRIDTVGWRQQNLGHAQRSKSPENVITKCKQTCSSITLRQKQPQQESWTLGSMDCLFTALKQKKGWRWPRVDPFWILKHTKSQGRAVIAASKIESGLLFPKGANHLIVG